MNSTGRSRWSVGLDTGTFGAVVDLAVAVVIEAIAEFFGGLIDDILEGFGKGSGTVGGIKFEATTGVALLAIGMASFSDIH